MAGDSLSTRLPHELQQTQWSSILNQLLKIPLLKGVAIEEISLVAATPRSIPIGLGRKQQGWFITDIDADASVWRTEDFNAQTLTLESDANVTISIWVY